MCTQSEAEQVYSVYKNIPGWLKGDPSRQEATALFLNVDTDTDTQGLFWVVCYTKHLDIYTDW